jgi:glycosyltransferase involved in cell wall biosynthesis
VPELSVIVPAYGRPDALRALLESLGSQTLDRARFEVIVVDDGSDPPLADAIPPELRAHTTWLVQPNAGPAGARNLALSHARGRVLHLVNSDGILAPDTLERHLAAHPAGAAPHAVLGEFDWLPEQRDALIECCRRLGLVFAYHRARPGVPLPFEFFWTGNLSVPAAAVRAVGGFDPGFRRAVWDDLELGYRLAQKGLPLHSDPTIRCAHDHPFPLADLLGRSRWLGHEWVRFADLHGAAAYRPLGPITAPTAATARTFLAAILDQFDAHADRIREAQALLDAADADLSTCPPADREALLASVAARFEPLAQGLITLSIMEGATAAILGYALPALADHRRRLQSLAVVHTLARPGDLGLVPTLLDTLPEGAELVVTHTSWFARDALPDDLRLRVTRIPDSLAPSDTWRPVLDATGAGTLVFVDGTHIPTPSELRGLARFLGASPRVGALGLGRRAGHPIARAALTEHPPTSVLAVPRAVITADAPGASTLLARIAARDLVTATLTPAGA